MPPDIHETLWRVLANLVDAGTFCWNKEIWNEIDGSIYGDIAQNLKAANKAGCLYDLDDPSWDVRSYIDNQNDLCARYSGYIAEYNGKDNTVGLNDVSIIALAKTLNKPVASMERENTNPGSSLIRMRIPELCSREKIPHLNFVQLLRKEGVKA